MRQRRRDLAARCWRLTTDSQLSGSRAMAEIVAGEAPKRCRALLSRRMFRAGGEPSRCAPWRYLSGFDGSRAKRTRADEAHGGWLLMFPANPLDDLRARRGSGGPADQTNNGDNILFWPASIRAQVGLGGRTPGGSRSRGGARVKPARLKESLKWSRGRPPGVSPTEQHHRGSCAAPTAAESGGRRSRRGLH